MTSKPKITLSPAIHRDQKVVKIVFKFNKALIDLIRRSVPVRWSKTMNCWYIFQSNFDMHLFFESLADEAFIDYSALKVKQQITTPAPPIKVSKPVRPAVNAILPDGYSEKLIQERYSANTIKIYSHYMKDFVAAFVNHDLSNIQKEEINQYILRLIRENDISSSQQNQRINAIKFYYERVLGKSKEFYIIDRPRKERRLPDVLSKEEIGQMLNVTTNIKHKTLIALIYSCGLRRSEAINMKIEDIDSGRMLIKIRGAKGKKDRYVQLAKSTLNMLRKYYSEEKPETWIFEGSIGKPYSATSIFNSVKEAAKKAKIKKRVYPHILRHSFATHHLEQGTDLRFIQEFLGHESSKTTEIYTHVSKSELSKFKNPIDDILGSG